MERELLIERTREGAAYSTQEEIVGWTTKDPQLEV
jgi:hypothetical protein